ncbi:Epsin-1, required for endocytosis and actin patch assembly [Phytophthora pseudosyringae]|uniref:Epsin-1, required for endocytosis and actin patch assembly n=1 Tax=Phytophthora pseudosyringae TaxID=221518 RepID=A0A8T1WGU8_9STRA|nr:Epsin-1, required for endocytosis and actin patch assembly [Phytophthora pseudosyringae]
MEDLQQRPPSASSTSALDSLDVSTIVPESVLSPEEIRLLKHKFAHCNTAADTKKVGAPFARLPASRACKLFREDYPSLSEWEIQAVFNKYDVNGDGHLSFKEYLQTRAYYRMLLEESTQMELQRIFSILDTDADGILLAHDVLHRIEQTRLHGVSMLKQVITQAAEATKVGVKSSQYYHREGEITFEHFSATIQDVNRRMEQGIATKTLRVIDLQQEQQQQHFQRLPKSTAVPDHKGEALRVEIDVLTSEIRRMKKELITDNNNALGEACERLMALYENEQHVYECLNNFITYCNLRDATLFRYNLEREGKRVNILNSMLLAPPEHLKTTVDYRKMMDLSLNHEYSKSSRNTPNAPQLSQNNVNGPSRPDTAKGIHASPSLEPTEIMLETLLMNATLRKQFAYYAMTGNVTNLVWITRTNFIKLVKDCKLDLFPTPALNDVDITNIFAAATGTGKAMDFAQLLSACILIFKRPQDLQRPLSDADVQNLVETHIIPRAKTIRVQQLAPDISQDHVMKLLKEHIWQFKQIFSHFGIQSLAEVDNKVRLDMKEFLTFARAFSEFFRCSCSQFISTDAW